MYGMYRDIKVNSYIRVFNAVPDSPAVDVYANGKLVATNLRYKQVSNYIPVAQGNYIISVYQAGEKTRPILSTNVYIPENYVANLVLIGSLSNMTVYPIPEPISPQAFGRACIRFANLSPSSKAYDVSLSDGTKIFNNIGYKFISDYACIPSGTYTFKVSDTGNNNAVVTIPDIQLQPNVYYTIYILGKPGEGAGLEGKLLLEQR